jgi:hypothetical protein
MKSELLALRIAMAHRPAYLKVNHHDVCDLCGLHATDVVHSKKMIDLQLSRSKSKVAKSVGRLIGVEQ